jgi:PepSY-associated TM region
VNRTTLTKLHMLLAAFMFPVALMFLVTGGFYTWGITGEHKSTGHVIALSQPLTKDEAALQAVAAADLVRRGIDLPTGKPRIRSIGESWHLEWTGSQRDVLLEPTADATQAKLTVKEATWYRNLVQLHKAKGGTVFKVYAAALAVSLLLLLATGFLLAWRVPSLRRAANASALAGIALFFGAVFLS